MIGVEEGSNSLPLSLSILIKNPYVDAFMPDAIHERDIKRYKFNLKPTSRKMPAWE
jgi:hypothetical protein